MGNYGYDEHQLLQLARERARELAADWRAANGPADRRKSQPAAPNPVAIAGGLVESARFGAGRTLIGLGTRLLPRREPCA